MESETDNPWLYPDGEDQTCSKDFNIHINREVV